MVCALYRLLLTKKKYVANIEKAQLYLLLEQDHNVLEERLCKKSSGSVKLRRRTCLLFSFAENLLNFILMRQVFGQPLGSQD